MVLLLLLILTNNVTCRNNLYSVDLVDTQDVELCKAED